MRKVISLMHISLDGYAAGSNGEMDFINVESKQMFADVHAHFAHVDTAIYGPATYAGMAAYWPTVPSNPESSPEDIEHANWVEKVDKIVFSTKLDKVEWNNTRLVKKDIAGEIARLKQLPGKDLMIFGSPRLTHSFMKLGLVDEYLLTLQPVILGQGIPFFTDIKGRDNLKLLTTKSYETGVILVHYETVRG